jgi:hypothetical protein
LVLIEQWGAVEWEWTRGDTGWLETEIRKLKALAVELGIVLIVEINVTKEASKWSSAADCSVFHLNGGVAWGNVADVILFVYALVDETAPEEQRGARFINVALSRDVELWGEPGVVGLLFDPKTRYWSTWAPPPKEERPQGAQRSVEGAR